MKRRDFLLTAGAIAGTAGLGAAGLGATGRVSVVGPRKASMPYDLIVQKARYKFTDQSTLSIFSLLPQAQPPVLVGHHVVLRGQLLQLHGVLDLTNLRLVIQVRVLQRLRVLACRHRLTDWLKQQSLVRF